MTGGIIRTVMDTCCSGEERELPDLGYGKSTGVIDKEPTE